mgnify:CR=1 FL=1
MFGTVENISKIPELRKKIFYTLGLIAIFRLGCFIPIPGIDTVALENYIDTMREGGSVTGTVFTMLNMFAGGAFEKDITIYKICNNWYLHVSGSTCC